MPLSSSFPSILIITGAKGDTRRYRAFHLWQQAQLAGVTADVCHITDSRSEQIARQSDFLIFHRTPYDARVDRLIQAVRGRGGLVLVDADDLIFDPSAFQWIDSPDFKDPVRAELYQAEMRRQQQTVLASDGVITSTDFLAGVARKMGKPAWVHRNAASLEMLEISNRAVRQEHALTGKTILGYASGTPTHNRDFGFIAPALRELLNSYPQAELWVIGHLEVGSGWEAFKNRLRKFDPVPWRELPFWLCQLDVNLAPLLLDNPFSQSKSEIKFMEAALVGVPTIASPTDAFRYAVRSGENGLLADDPASWFEALNSLMDSDKRSSLAPQAHQDVLANYTPQYRAQQLVTLFNHISTHFGRENLWPGSATTNSDWKRYNWPIEWEVKPTLVQMGWYSLQSRGGLTLLKQLWITFRRFIARWVPYR